jgi:hypothetical protein
VNTAVAITAIIAALLLANSIVTAIRDVAKAKHQQAARYPHQDGDFITLGPEIFTTKTGDVISWKGDNYVRQTEPPV